MSDPIGSGQPTAGRIFAGLGAASGVTALWFAVIYIVSWTLASRKPDWHGWQDTIEDLFSTLIIYGLSGAAVSLVIGLPAYLLYRRLGWRSWLAFALGGSAIGIAIAVLLIVLGTAMYLSSGPVLLAVCCVSGMLSALAFRAVAFGSSGERSRQAPVS
jgi:hypothetical protein